MKLQTNSVRYNIGRGDSLLGYLRQNHTNVNLSNKIPLPKEKNIVNRKSCSQHPNLDK